MKISQELKIGAVGLVALVSLFFMIKFLQGINLFEQRDTYYINFRNAKALAKSSPVYADGFNVGIVADISYDYDRPAKGVIVKIDVEHGMRIPKGTVAVLDEAMLGGCTLNLLMGNNPLERFQTGDTIPASDNNGLMTKAAEFIPKLEQTLTKVDSLLISLNVLATDTNLQRILANAERLTSNLDKSSQNLNKLLEHDVPQLAETFNEAGASVKQLSDKLNTLDLNGTLARVDGLMDNVSEMTNRLNTPDNTVGLLLNDTSLYFNLNQTLSGASALVEDLKAHPKRYVHFSLFGRKDKPQQQNGKE